MHLKSTSDIVVEVVDSTSGEYEGDADIVVFNKSDLLDEMSPRASLPREAPKGAISVSCLDRSGIKPLLEALTARAKEILSLLEADSEHGVVANQRHRTHLSNALAALDTFFLHPNTPETIELACEDLRLAGNEMGRVVGRVDVEDVLDSIFKDFCIGK